MYIDGRTRGEGVGGLVVVVEKERLRGEAEGAVAILVSFCGWFRGACEYTHVHVGKTYMCVDTSHPSCQKQHNQKRAHPKAIIKAKTEKDAKKPSPTAAV